MKSNKVIGRFDKADFPEFELENLDVKIDTGAFGCAIHCHHIEIIQVKGKEILRFELLDPSHPEFLGRNFTARQFGSKAVKSSSGEKQMRYTIITPMIIFGKKHVLEFSLTDRKDMRFPVLLGRTFLRQGYLVDVTRKNLSMNEKIKHLKK